MNKITPGHLARNAYVYVRQSTPDQLLNNPESRRRQYALVARAHALGWEHVNLTGDYVWAAPEQITENHDGLLPLRITPDRLPEAA